MKYAIICVFIVTYARTVLSRYCYWNTGCPYKYLGTKTSYSAVRGDIRDSLVKIKGCEPISIWGIFRHGKDFPINTSGDSKQFPLDLINNIHTSYKKGNCSLCAQDVDELLEWNDNAPIIPQDQHLSYEGKEEMKGVGKRFKQAFPKLLTNIKKENTMVRSTKELFVINSVQAFEEGLDEKFNDEIATKDLEQWVTPQETCEIYKTKVENNAQTLSEAKKYLTSPEYLATKDKIQRRTGINIKLSDEQIRSLYDLCRYSWSGLNNKPSPWCAIFTTDDLKVFEYYNDLISYYEDSYGSQVNEKLGHPLMNNLLNSFQEAKDGKGTKLTAYFGTNKMIHMVYTALGLFKDDKALTSAQKDPDRRFRTSKISAYSANFFAVLNRCTMSKSTDYSVVFYQNEEPLGSLCERRVCSWQEFEDKLTPFINSTLNFCNDN